MTLVKWTPITKRPSFSMFDDVNRLFNQMWRDSDNEIERPWYPALDIRDSEKSYMVNLDLPGMEKKDIEISVSNGVLTITGERKTELNEERESCIRSEISYGKFSRSFTLTDDVNEEDIQAKFKNGVLTLAIPKKEPVEPLVKQIAIK